jgi:hypothetical protein
VQADLCAAAIEGLTSKCCSSHFGAAGSYFVADLGFKLSLPLPLPDSLPVAEFALCTIKCYRCKRLACVVPQTMVNVLFDKTNDAQEGVISMLLVS